MKKRLYIIFQTLKIFCTCVKVLKIFETLFSSETHSLSIRTTVHVGKSWETLQSIARTTLPKKLYFPPRDVNALTNFASTNSNSSASSVRQLIFDFSHLRVDKIYRKLFQLKTLSCLKSKDLSRSTKLNCNIMKAYENEKLAKNLKFKMIDVGTIMNYVIYAPFCIIKFKNC